MWTDVRVFFFRSQNHLVTAHASFVDHPGGFFPGIRIITFYRALRRVKETGTPFLSFLPLMRSKRIWFLPAPWSWFLDQKKSSEAPRKDGWESPTPGKLNCRLLEWHKTIMDPFGGVLFSIQWIYVGTRDSSMKCLERKRKGKGDYAGSKIDEQN